MTSRILIALAGATAILLAGSVVATAAPGGKGDPEARIDRMIERVDADQSGSVTFEEFAARGDERFAKLDANGDGAITQEERDAAKEAAKVARADEDAKGGKKGRGGDRMAKLDADGDGTITRAEHDAVQQQRFASLDADESGDVTKEEFAAQMKQHRKGGEDESE